MAITNPRQLLSAPTAREPLERKTSFLQFMLVPALFAVLAIVVAGGSWFLLRPQPFVTAQITTSTVRAGDVITVVAMYRNAKNLGVDENALSVTDVSGHDVTLHDLMDQPMFTDQVEASQQGLLGTSTVEQRRQWGNSMQHSLGLLSGFSVGGEYDTASAYASSLSEGETAPYVAKLISCPTIPVDVVPTTITKEYHIIVLPQTPPGQYIVSIPTIFFCGSSAPSLSYSVTVEAGE